MQPKEKLYKFMGYSSVKAKRPSGERIWVELSDSPKYGPFTYYSSLIAKFISL